MADHRKLKHKYDMQYNDIKNMNISEEKVLDGQPQMLEKEAKINTETSYTITELREEVTVEEERVQFDETGTDQVHESFHKAHSSGGNTEKKMTDSEHIIQVLKHSEMEYLNLKEDQNKPGSKIGTCVSTHNEVRMSAAETEIKVIELDIDNQPIIPVIVAEDSKSIPKESSIENQKDAPSLIDEYNPNNEITENRESELPTKLEEPRERAKTDSPSLDIKIEKADEIIISESEVLILEVSSQLYGKEETQKDSIDKQDVSPIEQGLETEKVAQQSVSTDEAITQVKTESAEVNFNKEVSMNKDAEMDKVTSNKETKSKYKSKKLEKVPMKGDPKKYKKAESVKPDIKSNQSKTILKKHRTNKSHSRARKENTQLKEVKTVTVFQYTPPRMDDNGIDNEIIASGDNSINDATESVVMQNDKAVEDEVIKDSKINLKTISGEIKQREGDEVDLVQTEVDSEKKIKIDIPSVEIKRESEKEDFGFHLYGKRNLKGNFVSRVEPGSGADRAGLQVGDRLIMVGDTSVEKMKHTEIVDLIRNMKGPLRVSVANELQVFQQAREVKDQKDDSKLELSSIEEARPKPKRGANKANQDKSWKERKALFKNL